MAAVHQQASVGKATWPPWRWSLEGLGDRRPVPWGTKVLWLRWLLSWFIHQTFRADRFWTRCYTVGTPNARDRVSALRDEALTRAFKLLPTRPPPGKEVLCETDEDLCTEMVIGVLLTNVKSRKFFECPGINKRFIF